MTDTYNPKVVRGNVCCFKVELVGQCTENAKLLVNGPIPPPDKKYGKQTKFFAGRYTMAGHGRWWGFYNQQKVSSKVAPQLKYGKLLMARISVRQK